MSEQGLQRLRERLQHDLAFWLRFFDAPMQMAHELHEFVKKYFGHLPNFSWVIEHQIAGSGRPGTAEGLRLLEEHGIRMVISLTTKPIPAEWLAERTLSVTHIPLKDFAAPNMEQIKLAVSTIERSLAQNRPVLVHCGMGLGRTGTILACYLVAHGMGADEAIVNIRACRAGSIENARQEQAIHEYENRVRSEHT
jgi:atypical dual specificity phosphatase